MRSEEQTLRSKREVVRGEKETTGYEGGGGSRKQWRGQSRQRERGKVEEREGGGGWLAEGGRLSSRSGKGSGWAPGLRSGCLSRARCRTWCAAQEGLEAERQPQTGDASR